MWPSRLNSGRRIVYLESAFAFSRFGGIRLNLILVDFVITFSAGDRKRRVGRCGLGPVSEPAVRRWQRVYGPERGAVGGERHFVGGRLGR